MQTGRKALALNGRGERLTGREREVAELAARGLTTREIAGALFLSVPTVKSHLREVFRKCGVRNRVELAAWWVARGEEGEAGEAEATVAGVDPPARGRAGVLRRWRLALGAIALVVVGGIALFSPVGLDPWGLWGREPHLSPSPGWMTDWAFRTVDGRPLEVEELGECRLVEVRRAKDGWAGLELLFPREGESIEEFSRGWAKQGVYDCPYSYTIRSPEGVERTLPGGSVSCFGIVLKNGDGIWACEPREQEIEAVLRAAGYELADSATDP